MVQLLCRILDKKFRHWSSTPNNLIWQSILSGLQTTDQPFFFKKLNGTAPLYVTHTSPVTHTESLLVYLQLPIICFQSSIAGLQTQNLLPSNELMRYVPCVHLKGAKQLFSFNGSSVRPFAYVIMGVLIDDASSSTLAMYR